MAVFADLVQVVEVAVSPQTRVDPADDSLQVGHLFVLFTDQIQVLDPVKLKLWLDVDDVTLQRLNLVKKLGFFHY